MPVTVRVCVAVSGDRVTFISVRITVRGKSETHTVRSPPPPSDDPKKARGPHRKRRRKHGRDMQLSKEMLLDVRP